MSGNFTRQTVITFTTRVIQLILGLLASIIIARILGPESKGILSLVILLPLLLMTFLDFGIGTATVYYIGKRKYSLEEIFGANIIFSTLASVLSIVLGLVVIFFFKDKLFAGIALKYLLLGLTLIPFKVFLTFALNVLLGLQRIKKYNIVQLLQTVVYLLLVVIFILGFRFGIIAAILIEGISLTIASIFLFFEIKREAIKVQLSLSKAVLKDFLVYGVKAHSNHVLSFLHGRIDMFMLNYFLNPIAVGLYSIGVSIAEKLWLISQASGVVIFPRVSSETDAQQLKKFTPLVTRNVLAITTVGAAILFITAPWLVKFLYSEQYLPSIRPLQILLIGIVPVSVSRILTYDFFGRGKPILGTCLNGASVVLNVGLNIIFIPKFKIMGAAMATAISYTFVTVLAVVIYRNISGNSIRDIVFIKKADLKYYFNFLKMLRICK